MSTYTKHYENPYPDGYQDRPSEETPVTADILNMESQTLEAIETYLVNNPIAQKVSELTNDTGFITNTVSNLINYYNKAAVDNLIASVSGNLNIEVVEALPTTGISTTTFYLVPKADSADQNLYDEYINTNGTTSGWERLGDVSTNVDMSDYYDKGEIDDVVQVLNEAIANKVDKIAGKGLSTNDYTTTEKNKLAGIASGAEVNVQADWNVTDDNSDAFIKNKPTIPTVNNGILTIQKNGANVQMFSANQSGNVTANITVPTKTSELTNDSNFATANSPTFTGTPKAPTPADTDNSTRIATTAYVKTLISNLVDGAPETLNTLKEIADALEENDDVVQALNDAVANKADKTAIPIVGNTPDFRTMQNLNLGEIQNGVSKKVDIYTASSHCIYRAFGWANFPNNGIGMRTFNFLVNGSYVFANSAYTGENNPINIGFSLELKLNAGDKVVAQPYQTGNGNIVVNCNIVESVTVI